MIESLPMAFELPGAFDTEFQWTLPLKLSLLVGVGVLAFILSRFLPELVRSALSRLISPGAGEVGEQVVEPHKGFAGLVIFLLALDLSSYLLPDFIVDLDGFSEVEFTISLVAALAACLLTFRLTQEFFDGYFLDTAVKEGRKVNSEFLALSKVVTNTLVVVVVIILFGQLHQINVFGLVASLGVGGLAIAFAAQKTLEQLLGSVVIQIDRPFVVDDYIGLPDGTFGRVESVGLRSTRIRTSGKGTLMVVPNNALTQMNIENYTGAKKVMSLVYLNFHCDIPTDEQALIRQVILDSTSSISGLDSQSTDIVFKRQSQDLTQAQVTFFLLGSGDVSMELRQNLLGLAKQNITHQLKEYGIDFDVADKMVSVAAPITV